MPKKRFFIVYSVFILILVLSFNNKTLAVNEDEIKKNELLHLNESEQNSEKANLLRAELTGFSVEEVENFRSEKVPFTYNDAELYEIIFNDKKQDQEDPNVFNSLFMKTLDPFQRMYPKGRYNYATGKNNSNQNCYGYAIHRNIRVNPGYFAYNGKVPISLPNDKKKILSIDVLKNYTIADLKKLGKKPVLVSSDYVPKVNENLIAIRKGKIGNREDYHFMFKQRYTKEWYHKPGTTAPLLLMAKGWSDIQGWIPEYYDSDTRTWGINSGSYNSKTFYIKY